jgi:hypothetical protein
MRWSPAATVLARRYLRDQDGMRAVGVAVAALAADPYPLRLAAERFAAYHQRSLHVRWADAVMGHETHQLRTGRSAE